jgi:hypothetical protein
MNIFYLDSHPDLAAWYHCDKHVVKMVTEAAQILSTVHRVRGLTLYCDGEGLYKATHSHHPCTLWAMESRANYEWLYKLYRGLLTEYTKRYDKHHKAGNISKALRRLPHYHRGKGGHNYEACTLPFTEPPQVMPLEFQGPDTVQAYRNYYLKDKARFAKWAHGPQPHWWVQPKA